VYAPESEWPKPTALGLQMRHLLSARTHTSPAYAGVGDLATARSRIVTEGTRIAVRPYRWHGRLWAWIEVETSAIESETEERALALAVPSYRSRTAGTRIATLVDLGPQDRPGTVLLRGVPHPKLSRPEMLVEILVAVSIRHVPS
jgi:hypothetical protein